MKIETKDFGLMEISEQEIIYFPQGLFAFEDVTEFVFLHQEGYPEVWLQAVQSADPRFVVFRPEDLLDGYHPRLESQALRRLRADSEENLGFFVIAVVPEDISKMTVNLKSPIVVNFEKRLGLQTVLENQEYSVRQRIFE